MLIADGLLRVPYRLSLRAPFPTQRSHAVPGPLGRGYCLASSYLHRLAITLYRAGPVWGSYLAHDVLLN